MTTIEDLWRSFCDGCGLANAPEVQRVEMRRAFYAGFASSLQLVANISDNARDEDEGAEELDKLVAEYTAFFERGGM